MGEAKSFASLSSGLLARKGAAKPAMRRPVPTNHPSAFDHDDLTSRTIAWELKEGNIHLVLGRSINTLKTSLLSETLRKRRWMIWID